MDVWCPIHLWMLLLIHRARHVLIATAQEIGDLRLANGPTPNAGRVEFYLGFRGWYSTCDANWGIDDAIVVCKQLGFPGAALARTNSPYGSGAGVPLARDWECRGDENRLEDCKFTPKPRCEETVGVVCQAPGYLGCYADHSGSFNSLLRDGFVSLDHMSVSACRDHCRAGGAKLAGLKNGHECYCGRFYEALLPGNRQSDRQCQMPCTGNPDEVCGSERAPPLFRSAVMDKLSVFDLNLGQCDPPAQPAKGRVVGNEYSYGDVINFECKKGYKVLNGSTAAACVMRRDGTGRTVAWNVSVPRCEAAIDHAPRMAHGNQFSGHESTEHQYIILAALIGLIVVLISAILFIVIRRRLARRRAAESKTDQPPCYQDLVLDYEPIADPKTGAYPIDRASCYQSLRPPVPNRPPRYIVHGNIPGHPSWPEELWKR